MNNIAAQIIVSQMQNSPELMDLLVTEAIDFLAQKHTVLASDIERAYVEDKPAVVAQVQELIVRGWVTAHANYRSPSMVRA